MLHIKWMIALRTAVHVFADNTWCLGVGSHVCLQHLMSGCWKSCLYRVCMEDGNSERMDYVKFNDPVKGCFLADASTLPQLSTFHWSPHFHSCLYFHSSTFPLTMSIYSMACICKKYVKKNLCHIFTEVHMSTLVSIYVQSDCPRVRVR